MDTVSEERLSEVAPGLAAKIRQMADTLAQQNIYVRVVQGLRTVEEQDALYAQGRTAPGEIVTNAPGGFSQHNFGLACDLVPSTGGVNDPYEPDWDSSHQSWQTMIQVGESLGLVSGSSFTTLKDMPHFEYTEPYPSSTSDEQRTTLSSGGLQAVWQTVGVAS